MSPFRIGTFLRIARKPLLTFSGIAFVLFCFASNIFAEVIYVKYDAAGVNDGTSWTDAFTDLQPAIDSATSGDEVWISKGTYKPTSWPNGGGIYNYDSEPTITNSILWNNGGALKEVYTSQGAPNINNCVN